MNVLVACEESQTVTKAFREHGHTAFSCDIIKPSGGHKEWHIRGDVTPMINGNCTFTTMDGSEHELTGKWDLIIAHPPCTYMSRAGAKWMYPTAGCINEDRLKLALDAKDFFMKFINADCDRICVENPRPLRVVALPKPTQVVQPYEYGHPYSKATCLWLKGLPPLVPTNVLSDFVPYLPSNTGGFSRGRGGSSGIVGTAKNASKTFSGIAEAMVMQWGSMESPASGEYRCIYRSEDMKSVNKSMNNKNDERYTPPILVRPILKYIKPKSTVWCPFDKENSEFVISLKEAGHNVIFGHIDLGQDFFEYEPEEYDYIISNPPFSKKLEVLERLYKLNKPFAMLMNIECLNYQVVGEFFLDKNLELLIVDKKVSFDGNTASFNTSYFCNGVLPKQLMFEHLEHNNTGKNFIGSRMC